MAGGASYEKPNQRRALEVEELKKELADIWKTIYPVGSIYMSVNSTNPSSLFGRNMGSVGKRTGTCWCEYI